MWHRHHASVAPIGVVDVGSNTVRLLVSARGKPVLALRENPGLGACIEREGTIPTDKLAETALYARRFVEAAAEAGASDVEVLITSPGRQATNGAELRDAIATATGTEVRILSAREEGRLAFVGALDSVSVPPRRRMAVVDVGGGSAQVVVGSERDGITWSGTIDLGSRRLASRMLRGSELPQDDDLAAARAEVDALLAELEIPPVRAALAVGGTARALKRIAGGRLGRSELDRALSVFRSTAPAKLVRRYDVSPERAEILASGATILAAIQDRLDVPLRVVRSGLREGAIGELERRRQAA